MSSDEYTLSEEKLNLSMEVIRQVLEGKLEERVLHPVALVGLSALKEGKSDAQVRQLLVDTYRDYCIDEDIKKYRQPRLS